MRGLSSTQAAGLLSKYGLNEIPSKKGASVFTLIVSKFKNVLTLLLVCASIFSFLGGDQIDGILVLAILLLNVSLDVWQEYKASKELEALRKMGTSKARVLRDGGDQSISSSLLVPGDVIILEQGDRVPADAILIEAYNLSVNESALTGEALAITKSSHTDNRDIFQGTVVTSGHAKAEIIATGGNTRFGKISLTLSDINEEITPLEVALQILGKKIGIFALCIATVVFIIRLIQNFPIRDVFFTSTALFVAAVPEGLSSVIALALTLGARRMYKRNTLVRKLSAIESLGAVTVICTDKTGTLTENKMFVHDVSIESGLEDEFVKTVVLCNNASLVMSKDTTEMLGDTTEGALLVWAHKKNIEIDDMRAYNPVLDEIPFNLKTRLMSVFCRQNGQTIAYIKGAPEAILSACDLSVERKNELVKEFESHAAKGYRVIAAAMKTTNAQEEITSGCMYLGFAAISDPPRKNVQHTIGAAKRAGIKIVMITGDNELTAKAIAEEVGLLEIGDEIITGNIFNQLTDEEVMVKLPRLRIIARATPEDKLRLIRIYQARGEIVAVTGDGVNDSLALKQAHVGVAMGKSGTDVAKEASDIVILDDNFSTIVTAVEEGKKIYTNMMKVIRFLLGGNLSELLLIFFATVLNLPSPLMPVQLLWINFVTDGIPALALIVDPASKGVLHSNSQRGKNALLDMSTTKVIVSAGLIISLISLCMFWYAFKHFDLVTARGIAFSSIIFLQMIYVFLVRGNKNILSNRYLLIAVITILLLQVLFHQIPYLNEVFAL